MYPSRLYHYTDASNIDSILRIGLMPGNILPVEPAHRPWWLEVQNYTTKFLYLSSINFRRKDISFAPFRGANLDSNNIVKITLGTSWIIYDKSFRHYRDDVFVTEKIIDTSEIMSVDNLSL